MSAFSTPNGAAPAQPKQISNRLLNMKFMQRAAASTTQSPNPPPSSEPQPKRRRTGDHTTNASQPTTPSTTSTPTRADRSSAFASPFGFADTPRSTNHYTLDGIETEWILPGQIPSTGAPDSNEHDASSSEDDIWTTDQPCGRQCYGAFKRKKPAATKTAPFESKYEPTKRRRDTSEEDEGEVSDVESEDGEVSGLEERGGAGKRKKKQGKSTGVDYVSENAMRKMDALDFQRPGFDHGFGRHRQGLAGGLPGDGNGNGSGRRGFGNGVFTASVAGPTAAHGLKKSKGKKNKKARRTM